MIESPLTSTKSISYIALGTLFLDILSNVSFLSYFKAIKRDLQEMQFIDLCKTDKKPTKSRTAAFWPQYKDYATTVKYFIFPEGTSKLLLHL